MSQFKRQAIALAYGRHPVPMVTAKGEEEMALRILAEARKEGVFISEDPQLVALLSRLRVDEQIPPVLYTVVAVVLS